MFTVMLTHTIRVQEYAYVHSFTRAFTHICIHALHPLYDTSCNHAYGAVCQFHETHSSQLPYTIPVASLRNHADSNIVHSDGHTVDIPTKHANESAPHNRHHGITIRTPTQKLGLLLRRSRDRAYNGPFTRQPPAWRRTHIV